LRWTRFWAAIHAALFIQVYRDQPVLQQPFRLLTAIVDLDELMTNWRYRHALQNQSFQHRHFIPPERLVAFERF
jgi:tryptophan 2,3-dioxygenase